MNPKKTFVIALSLLAIAGGIILLNRNKDNTHLVAAPLEQPNKTRSSERWDSSAATARPRPAANRESPEELAEKRKQLRIERDKMTEMWMQNASNGLQHTRKNLIADLDLTDEESAGVEIIFARRERELSAVLAEMTSGESRDDKELFRELTALLRNKGLRDDLSGVLNKEQLEVFDTKEAKRERETVEARAYRDMAEINSVVRLTDTQKKEVLGALIRRASEKVEHEADTRAYMSLMYGGLANEIESANIRGVTNLVHEGLLDEGPAPDIEYDSAEYGNIALERKEQRIESEIANLSDVLDEAQLTRYREHLEKEPAW